MDVAPTLQGGGKRGYRVDAETPAGGAMRKGNGNVTGGVPFVAQPLTAREGKGPDSDTTSGTPLVPMAFGHTNGLDVQASESVTPTLRAGHDVGGGSVMTPATDSVRRLTPVECERLQGYPDGWTATSNGRPQADSARYRQLGNSIAVPVFAWVARRLTAYESNGGGLMIPDAPTQTIRVAELVPGDRVIVPMVGNIETVLSNDDGLVSTDGTGPNSAYPWLPAAPIDVVSRATGS